MSEQVRPQSEHQASEQEPIVDAELYPFINAVGNHEAKLLTAAVIASQPTRWFTSRELELEMVSRQGAEVAWPMRDASFQAYCEKSFEPIGAIVKSTVQSPYGRWVRAFRAHEDKADNTLALAGCFLDWSLAYPEISLQRILGSTASRSAKRSPQTRLQIFQDMLTSPEPSSMTSIAVSLGYANDLKYILTQLESMREIGTIELTTKMRLVNPTLHIANTKYSVRGLPLAQTSKENQAIYSTLTALQDRALTLEQLLAEIGARNSAIDMSSVRRSLLGRVREGVNALGIRVIEDLDLPSDQLTLVRMPAQLEQPIVDLIEAIDAVANGASRRDYMDRALAIISNHDDVRLLMRKAKNESSGYQGWLERDNPAIAQRIISVLEGAGGLTAQAVVEVLQREGQNMTIHSAMSYLRQLAVAGAIGTERRPVVVGSKQIRAVYFPLSK